ncbi:hypothetical protein LEP1GSC172_0844 [Leptospira noguchii]|uniref:Uncharacterized protein n=1 Tax=Leptospira noguchii TaxID=28182 RepID=M6V3P6_9LEPT|nr:hypothetical protein LEP1GSC172_0844 [Leptospira noguchii]
MLSFHRSIESVLLSFKRDLSSTNRSETLSFSNDVRLSSQKCGNSYNF